MTEYIYRTTTSSCIKAVVHDIKLNADVEVDLSVYQYAYKPIVLVADRWGENRRCHERLIKPVQQKFKALKQKPHPWGIIATENNIDPFVYSFRRRVSISDLHIGGYYPLVGRLLSIKYNASTMKFRMKA